MSPYLGKFWMVVNVSDTDPRHFSWEDDRLLPSNRRPKYLHDSMESAESEALRLHRKALVKVPAENTVDEIRFAVVEAVSFTEALLQSHARLVNYGAEEPVVIPARAKKRKKGTLKA